MGNKWPIIMEGCELTKMLHQYYQNYTDFFKYHSSSESTGHFDNIGLTVDGEDIGPLNNLNLEKLIEKAEPCKFGLGDKDVFDETVRKAKEIKGERIRFYHIKRNFGCSDSQISLVDRNVLLRCYTECRLHKLCIYEEGGFFEKHVDSVHDENHYGSAVVCLPTDHEGGELIIRFDSKEKVINFSENKTNYQAASFYTDCEHKVKPVTKGTRVVLQYDLISIPQDNQYLAQFLSDQQHENGVKTISATEMSHVAANKEIVNKIVTLFENFNQMVIDHDNECSPPPALPLDGIPAIFLGHRYTFKGIDNTKLKGIDKQLYDDLSPYFDINVYPVVVDVWSTLSFADGSMSAYLFDHDLVFGIKTEHEMLNEKVTIVTSESLGKSVQVLQKIEHAEFVGNNSQPFEMSYISAIMTLRKKQKQ